MRREPNKASKDSANGKQSRLSTSRRRSISCSRLAPSPQMDVTEMRKLATPKASTHEPPTRNRVDSPELSTNLNVLGMQKTHHMTLARKSAMPVSIRRTETIQQSSQQKQSSWFNPMKWLKKIRDEQHNTVKILTLQVSKYMGSSLSRCNSIPEDGQKKKIVEMK
eukprot:g4320.t1